MIALIAVGVLLGADEVAVTAAAKAVGGTPPPRRCSPCGAPGRSSAGLLVTRLGGERAPPPGSRSGSARSRPGIWR